MMATLFAVSAFTLVSKFLMPTPIQIIIPGEEPVVVGQIFRYTQIDVLIMSVSTVILAVSGFHLLFSDFAATRKSLLAVEQEDASELDIQFARRLLDGDKRKVFSTIVESGGEILQSDLPLQTSFSKAKITRILDYLELKDLVVRQSYGMTNKVIINRDMRAEKGRVDR